jgi:hypothetical protein
MTFYNANVYVADPDKWAHDDCLPDDQFEPVIINGQDTGERQQKSPWNWSPVYGAPKSCYICGKPVR